MDHRQTTPSRHFPAWLRIAISLACVIAVFLVYAGWEWHMELGCGQGVTFSPTGCYVRWGATMGLAVERLYRIGPQTALCWKLSYALAVVFPAALIAGVFYAALTRRFGKSPDDGETRCRVCKYILRGISSPQCPECGERI